MLMSTADYDCFSGDFYDSSADRKEILETLNNVNTFTNHDQLSPGDLTYELVNNSKTTNAPLYGYMDYIDGKLDGYLVSGSTSLPSLWAPEDLISTTEISPLSPPELASDLDSRYWESKPPDQWTSEDVWHWIFTWASDLSVDIEEVQPLAYSNINGQQLAQMSPHDFLLLNEKYGLNLYENLQQLLERFKYQSSSTVKREPTESNMYSNLPSFELFRSTCMDMEYPTKSDRESTSSTLTTINESKSNIINLLSRTTINTQIHNQLLQQTELKQNCLLGNEALSIPIKKPGKRGRPPKKDPKSRHRQGKGNGKLWEFIRDLLLDPSTNPSLIRWERREDGIFKFVQSDKVAKLWGQRKHNHRMTYEKLSRAMRYYYKSQVLLPVFGRRLVYKFGPNATGWRGQQFNLM